MTIPMVTPWSTAIPGLFFTPFRHNIPLEEHRDPVTGATIRRLHKDNDRINSNSAGIPIPWRCSTKGCVLIGQPHEVCKKKDSAKPFYCSKCGRNCSCPGGPRVRFSTPHGTAVHPAHIATQQNHEVATDTQQEGFERWLANRPNAHLSRPMPPNWTVPTFCQPLPPNLVYSTQVACMPLPVVAGGHPILQPVQPVHPVQPVQPVWCSVQPAIAALPAVPGFPPGANVTNWNHMPAGAATPFPWIAHPLPHPSMPAQQFWQQAAPMQMATPWRGSNGLTFDQAAVAQSPYNAFMLTGGHPLPGQNTAWTPAMWPLPALDGHPTPNATAPPGYVPGTIFLAPWLIPNPRNSLVPHILWDVSIDPPSAIKRLTGRGDIVDFAGTSAFECLATYPASEKVHIQIPNMRPAWGPVSIKKKDGKEGVRVCDIFEGIWKFLHKPLTHEDMASILHGENGGGAEKYRKLELECWRRCMNSHSIPEVERRQGFKRVDLLEGNTLFWGMWLNYTPDGRWYLSMSFCPSKSRSR